MWTRKIDALAVGELNPEIGEIKGYSGLQIPSASKSIGDIVIAATSPIFQVTGKEK